MRFFLDPKVFKLGFSPPPRPYLCNSSLPPDRAFFCSRFGAVGCRFSPFLSVRTVTFPLWRLSLPAFRRFFLVGRLFRSQFFGFCSPPRPPHWQAAFLKKRPPFSPHEFRHDSACPNSHSFSNLAPPSPPPSTARLPATDFFRFDFEPFCCSTAFSPVFSPSTRVERL